MVANAAKAKTVNEKPILFSGPMVRAILEGRKTQTRRVIKLPPAPNHLGTWEGTTIGGEGDFLDKAMTKPAPELFAIWHTRTGKCIASPYQAGNRLWVRETFAVMNKDAFVAQRPAPYGLRYKADPDAATALVFRPSIFMPRWASRITLEIADVRVERLQEIARADAIAEGVEPFLGADETAWRAGFQLGWNEINARRGYSWESNPWVWVLTFKTLNVTAR